MCWGPQGSGAAVHGSGEIPEGQAAIRSCTAQDQPPGSQERAARSVKGMGRQREPLPNLDRTASLTAAG